jgi:hypothetical protein
MGLQYYDLVMPVNGSKEFSAQGKYLYYLTGTTPNITAGTALVSSGNQAIKVRAGLSGNEIILMPGQGYRLDEDEKTPGAWRVANANNQEAITGMLMIGNGEFQDSNIAGAFTLSAANIPNAAALPVQKQALNTITQFATVNIGLAASLLVSDATQRCLRIRNTHATAYLYLGTLSGGLGASNAGICIPPGGMWIEEEAAGAAWYAISDTAGTIVAIQGLKV